MEWSDMSIWEKLFPHRQLINRSLRKNADELRSKIDAYKLRCDEQYQKNLEDLEQTRIGLDQQYKGAKDDVIELLTAFGEELGSLEESTTTYISAYSNKQLVGKKKGLNMLRQEAVKEYIDFLSEQMNLIGQEVDQLRKRCDLLANKARIDDVIQLIALSGNTLPVEGCTNAQELLNLITIRKDETDNDIEKHALQNVRTLLEERVSFLDEIQYISWVIEQKIQLSKELKNSRNEQSLIQKTLHNEAGELETNLEKLNSLMYTKAREIRFYWAKAIVNESIGVDDLKAEKQAKIEKKENKWREKDDIQRQINNMKSSHSGDNWKWNRLQEERKDLESDIRSLSATITDIGNEVSKTIERRDELKNQKNELFATLWKYSIPLVRLGNKGQNDEEIYVDTRLKELEAIERSGKTAAEEAYQNEVRQLKTDMQAELEKIEHNVGDLQKKLGLQEKEHKTAQESLQEARANAREKAIADVEKLEYSVTRAKKEAADKTKKWDALRAADNRFFLIRAILETPESRKAKQAAVQADGVVAALEKNLQDLRKRIDVNLFPEDSEVQKAQKRVADAKGAMDQIQNEFNSMGEKYKQTEQEFARKINQAKPHRKRPTADECSEMCRLKMWRKQQREKRQRKRRN